MTTPFGTPNMQALENAPSSNPPSDTGGNPWAAYPGGVAPFGVSRPDPNFKAPTAPQQQSTPAAFAPLGGSQLPDHPPTPLDGAPGLGGSFLPRSTPTPPISSVPQPQSDQSFSQRIQLLNKTHSWMPYQTLAAIAASPGSTQDMMNMADAVRKTASSTMNYFFQDPVLQQKPTPLMYVRALVTGSLGQWPIQDADLQQIQQQLIKQGMVPLQNGQPSLQADGVWNQGWNSAFDNWKYKNVTAQLGGNRTGGVSVGHALNWMGDLLPTKAIDAIAGFATSLPGTAREIAATIAGGVAGAGAAIPETIMHGNAGINAADNINNTVGRGIISGLGGNPNQDPVYGPGVQKLGARQGAGLALQDISSLDLGAGIAKGITGDSVLGAVKSMLNLHSVMRDGSNIANAAGDLSLAERIKALRGLSGATKAERIADAGRLGLQDAVRGPGVIANSIGKVADKATQVFDNFPVLRTFGPTVSNLADAEGLYYKARTLLATPYSYAPVRVAGDLTNNAAMLSAKLHAAAAASNLVGGPNQLSNGVENNTYGDTINAIINNNTKVGIGGWHGSANLNDLMFLLHGPMHGMPGALSEKVGTSVENLRQQTMSALAESGLGSDIERALNHSYAGKNGIPKGGLNLSQWAAKAGEDNFASFYSQKVRQIAVEHSAEARVAALPREQRLAATTLENGDSVAANARLSKEFQNELYATTNNGDWSGVNRAVQEMKASTKGHGANELTLRLIKDIAHGDHMNTLRNPLSKSGSDVTNMENYLQAQKLTREKILSEPQSLVHQGLTTDVINPPKSFLQQVHETIASGSPDAPKPQEFEPTTYKRKSPLASDAAGTPLTSEDAKLGKVGIAKNETLTTAQAAKDLQDFKKNVTAVQKAPKIPGAALKRANQVEINPLAMGARQFAVSSSKDTLLKVAQARKVAAQNSLNEKIGNYIFHNFGIAADNMPHDINGKMKALHTLGSKLAKDVFINPDTASPELIQAVKDLGTRGFKLVHGTDIGHQIKEADNLDIMKGGSTFASRVASKIGLDLTHVSTATIGSSTIVNLEREIDLLIAKHVITPPPGYDGAAITRLLRNKDALAATDDTAVQRLANKVGHANKTLVKIRTNQMMKGSEHLSPEEIASTGGLDAKATEAQAKAAIIKEAVGATPLSQIRQKQVMQILTDPNRQNMIGQRGALFSPEDAKKVYGAVLRSQINPAWMLGATRLEYIAQAKLSYGGKDAGTFRKMMEQGQSIPPALLRLRTDMRFTLNPEFSVRRWVKASAKLAADGISPVHDPIAHLYKNGTLDKAMQLLDEVQPGAKLPNQDLLDSGNQYLASHDIFSIDQGPYYKAYAALEAQKAGMSNEQISQLITRTFSYGSNASGAGRTAAEKTANWIFFPLSFDKTLYRNAGAFLMDRPSQQILLTAGLHAYNQFNQMHPNGNKIGSASWFEKRMPIIREAQRMNAFTYGLSLGQIGGLNAPLLNLFLPQKIPATPAGLQSIKDMKPLWDALGPQLGTRINSATGLMAPELKYIPSITSELLQTAGAGMTAAADTSPSAPPSAINSLVQQQGMSSADAKVFWGIFHAQPVGETSSSQNNDAYSYLGALKKYAAAEKASGVTTFPNDPAIYGKYAGQKMTEWKGAKLNGSLISLVQDKYPGFQAQSVAAYTQMRDQEIGNLAQGQPNTKAGNLVKQFISAANNIDNAIYKNPSNPSNAQQTLDIRAVAIGLVNGDKTLGITGPVKGFLALYNKYFRARFGPLEGINQNVNS